MYQGAWENRPFRLLAKMFSLATLFAFSANAATYSSLGTPDDVTKRINSARDGDTVTIPAGSFTWARGVSISKGITLQGEGEGVTTIRNISGGVLISVTSTARSGTRITGLTLLGEHTVGISGFKNAAPYRVDHCTFDDGTTSQAELVAVGGNGPGLIDQCQFVAGSASEMIHNLGVGPKDASGWQDEIVPGSSAALYIEDCTFSKNPLSDRYFWGTCAIQSYYGARTVLRHCRLNYCHIDQHGTPGAIGARWWEFYENTFYVPPQAAQGGQSDYFALRGGSGVVFNNHLTGYTANPGSIYLYDENGGSSPLYLARGINKNYSPVYLWGNDSTMSIYIGSPNIVKGRDYFVSNTQPTKLIRYQRTSDSSTTTYSYTPFPYPHPLRNATTNQKTTSSDSVGASQRGMRLAQ